MVNIGAIMDTGFTVLLIIITAGCLIALGIFIWSITRYKHKFRVKKITGTKTIVIDDKAKEFRDRDGILWWKLLKLKHIIAVPPADCLDVTDRGRHSVEAYYSDESGYQYEKSATFTKEGQKKREAHHTKEGVFSLFDDGKEETIKNLGLAFIIPWLEKKLILFNYTVYRKKCYDPKKGKYIFIEDKKPSTSGTDVLQTKQKVIMVNQLVKAKARKGFSWREHIPLIVGVSALVMMVAIGFIFFDNIVEPIKPIVEGFNNAANAQLETTRMLQEMIQKKQIIPAGMAAAAGPQQLNLTLPPS